MTSSNDADRTTTDDLSRRGFLRATGAAGASVALTGIGAAETTDSSADRGNAQQSAGTLRLINESMTTLDPIKAEDTASGEVTTQIFDGLLNWPNGELPVEPLLAEGYEESDDFTTFTFSLKQGAQFHGDYGEVTAQDVVYSWERLAASDESRTAADLLTSVGVVHETDDEGAYVPGSMAVEAVDDYTVRMEIEEAFASALQVLANNQFAVVPEGVVGDIEGYDGEMEYQTFATENPVGAGPFTFDSWELETEASVSAFDDYHGSGPEVDGVHWQVITDANARYTYAMNQNADAFEIPTAQYDRNTVSVENTDDQGRETGTYGPVRNDETLNYESVVTLNVYYIGFNMNQVDAPARRATAHALNQHNVIDQVFKGRGEAAYHYMTPAVYPGGPSAYEQHARENYPYGYDASQLDQARQVMEEAGYGPNDRYEFELLAYESSEAWQSVGQLLRDQLASAHIDLTISVAPFSTLLNQVREGSMEAYTLGWTVPWGAPDAFVKHLDPAQSDPTQTGPEAYNYWSPDSGTGQRATEAWQTMQNNRAPTDEAEQARNEAAVAMEEANWEAVANLPVFHESEERFSYQWADLPLFGAGASYRQKYNEVTLDGRS